LSPFIKLEFGTWILEFGIWNLELGTWNLGFGIWHLEFKYNLLSTVAQSPGRPSPCRPSLNWNLELGFWNLDLGSHLVR
jgi:hypothetical protein